MGVLDIFKSSTIDTTSFTDFRNKLVKLRNSNLYPFEYNLPQAISLPYDFWKEVVKIYRYTYKDGLERAFSLFWADGEILFTQVKTGSSKMVKSGASIQVKYSHHPTKEGYARKELYIDEKLIKKVDVYHKKVPRDLQVQYLFNIHTHPKHMSPLGKEYYNFFSAQDIKSLISSKAIVTGLITDHVWLLIRTDKTPGDVNSILDNQITPNFLENDLHIGLYKARFNKKAYRYKFVKDN
jgi:hypothetical protein